MNELKVNHYQEKKKRKWSKASLLRLLLFLFLFVLLSVVVCVVIWGYSSYVEDNWFMFAHAEFIEKFRGFPTTDFLTMHDGMDFMIPQWLFAVLIYQVRGLFGGYGLTVLMLLATLTLSIVQMFNAKTVNDNKKNRWIMVLLTMCFFQLVSSHIRPYIFTVLFCCLEIFCIEKWIKSSRSEWLVGLPILSFLQINMHNSLWVSLLLVWICYIAEWIWYKIRKENTRFKILPLLIGGIGILLTSLLNPYGLDYVLYIFPSMEALKPLGDKISELRHPDITCWYFWIPVLLEAIWISYLIFFKKKRIPLAYLLLWGGFAVMGAWAIRNIVFTMTCGQIILFATASELPNLERKWMRNCLIGWGVSFSCVCLMICGSPDEFRTQDYHTDIDTFLETFHPEGETAFNEFDPGSYLEYNGVHPYIDTRAEIFGKAVNGQYDYSQEYVDINYGCSYSEFQDFTQRYSFDWLVLANEDLIEYAEKLPTYEKVYTGTQLTFFERVSQS